MVTFPSTERPAHSKYRQLWQRKKISVALRSELYLPKAALHNADCFPLLGLKNVLECNAIALKRLV